VEQLLAAPVALLGADLRAVRAAVLLEVHLAGPHGCAGAVLRHRGREEVRDAAHGHPRHAGKVGGKTCAVDHRLCGPAAAVAVPVEHQRRRRTDVVGEVARGEAELRRGDQGVVGVDGGEVREHPRAVEALPPERVVGEPVRFVPAELLGEEPLCAAERDDLRQGRGVAEVVRQERAVATPPEPALERTLALRHLAQQALAVRQVEVRLHPHAAHGPPPALRDEFRDAREHHRVVLCDPRVVLGLAVAVHHVGVALQQVHRVGERAQRLAPRLAHRPQPRSVEMGVARGGDAVGRGSVRHREDLRELRAGCRGQPGHVVRVDRVARRLQRGEQPGALRRLRRQVDRQVDHGVELRGECCDLRVAHDE